MYKMKESRVEWIGNLPEDWNIIRLKFLIDYSNVGESIGKELWSDDNKDQVFYSAGMSHIYSKEINFPSWKYTKKNDLLLSRNGTPYVYFPIVHAQYSDHIIRVSVNVNYDKKYIMYCLQNSIDSEKVESVSLATWSISLWKEQKLPCPTLEQQKIIVSFLEKKISIIDSIIEKEQILIEKLKEYKSSLITEVVTKGLNPNTDLKKCDCDFCPVIPSDWKVLKNKYLFSLRDERNYKDLSEVNLLSLYADFGVFPHGEKEERGNKAVTAEGYKIVYENDIVVNIILAWMGAIGRSAYNGVTSPAYDIYKPNTNVCSRYYHYLFRTKLYSGECYKYGRGIMAMRWRTYSDEFRNIKVPVPPYSEQIKIADFLDKKSNQIDKNIQDRKAAIEKLQEYKKSIIYEVVTGKREV